MKQIKLLSHALILVSALALGCIDSAYGASVLKQPPVPDFTRGGEKDDSHDWMLGPTGRAVGFTAGRARPAKPGRSW